jgi:hypothetical protein
MLIYVYDIKIKDKKVLNNIKRRFYYNLNRKFYNKIKRYSKSVIGIDNSYEKELDSFLNSFRDYLDVYKLDVSKIEKILEVNPVSYQ